MKVIQAGVFLPSVQSGWLHSSNIPYTPGNYLHTRQVARLAELLGFSFVLSPQNWRGGEGPSNYWRNTVESLSLTGALLEATSNITVVATAHVNVHKPPTVAKMIASLSEIGGGRVGLNVVTGGHRGSFEPFGFWDATINHDQRYDMADEWLSIIRAMWVEEDVKFDGRYFSVHDANMWPKPRVRPLLVNAGGSPRGLKFAASKCDIAFLLGGKNASFTASALEAKKIAKAVGNSNLRTFGLVTIVAKSSDAEAEAYADWIDQGVDFQGLENLSQGYKINPEMSKMSSSSLAPMGDAARRSFLPGPYIGSYETVARELATTVKRNDLDGLLIIVPDYISDLNNLARIIFPLLVEHGVNIQMTPTDGG